MTTTQWFFVVFYAIFWGATASVQGRWKMFHWPLIRYGHVARRILLSFIVLNVLPILFFAWVFFLLRSTPTSNSSSWDFLETLRQVVAGVVPAFAVFGFYRLWLAIVEINPTIFYQHATDQQDSMKDIEPTLESLNVHSNWWFWNLVFAVIYILVAILIPICLL